MGKLAKYVGSQEPTHRKVGSKPDFASKEFSGRVGPMAQIHVGLPNIGCLFIYLFIYEIKSSKEKKETTCYIVIYFVFTLG
jgi:hypothetical protein